MTSKKIKIMSFNISAENLCLHNNSKKVLAIIKNENPDILGIQETFCHNEETNKYSDINLYNQISEELHYSCALNEKHHIVIFSKFPIIHISPIYKGIIINYYNNIIGIFNIHLTDEPYQPFQLNNIEYGDYPFITTEEEAIMYAKNARQTDIINFINEIELMNSKYNLSTTIVLGDFNEPSHRDWTNKVANDKFRPIKVEFPSIKYFETKDFIDSYRHIYPIVNIENDYTWPTNDTYKIKDRIDYILVKSNNFFIKNAEIIGEKNYDDWPSDHRACICTIENYYNKYIKYKKKYLLTKINI